MTNIIEPCDYPYEMETNQDHNELQDSSPMTSKFAQNDNFNSHNNYNDNDNDFPILNYKNELKENEIKIMTLQSQNLNLKKQISIFEEKNKFFEADYLSKTNDLSNQIKEFNKRTSSFQLELLQKTKMINSQSNTIVSLDKENSFLKDHLSEMESSFEYLKQEVKKLLQEKDKSGMINQQQKIDNENKSKALIQKEQIKTNEIKAQLKESSEEIALLKKENMSLQKNNERLTHQNNTFQNNLQELTVYQKENHSLLLKLKEYEEYNSQLEKDKYNLESSLSNLTQMQTQNEKALYTYDNSFKEVFVSINSEIQLLTQWIDTYLGVYFDRNFEVPTLQTNKVIDGVQFDQLRNALEKSYEKLNTELSNHDQIVHDLKDEVHQNDIKNYQLKKELNELKESINDYKDNELRRTNEIDCFNKEIKEYQDRLNKHTQSMTIKDKETNDYITKLFNIIKEEIDSISQDDSFGSFNDIISLSNMRLTKGDCSLRFQFEDLLDKILQIFSELKIDYIKNKQQNLKLTSDTINRKIIETKDITTNLRKMNELEQELFHQAENISKCQSENMLLINQIGILENSIKTKDLNENDLRQKLEKSKEEYKIITKKYNELCSKNDILLIQKDYNDGLIAQFKDMTEKYKQADIKLHQLEKELQKARTQCSYTPSVTTPNVISDYCTY